MHIILTHEQSDFDALASLLGAYLVEETAIPVLPNRMNRNVRAFITLYGAELPFVERRDLPSGPISQVTLVDTQAMVSVKGIGPDTRVQVIDHHDPRGELPANWSLTRVDTGANTTLFAETLRERDARLTMIQATLLLMGIYEDTGSLTYARTTPRDLRAAAYLLQAGASLQIAVEFLNHPLSLQQQELYDHLRQDAQTLNVHGHHVIVACGDARNMDEELSTIAHKMRDLLDPDALILLVTTRGGVQMIARSTTDNVDVAELTAHFGGGGHARAAAVLIHDRPLEEVRQELVAVLPRFVRPALTVAEIMSRGAQVLSPEIPAETALMMMQRSGHEGYPVVQAGKVIGLLNRRAVDRSVGHKLNLPASSLMEAGEVTVRPEDSIQHLQRLMTDTGWGQVPVVDPQTGEVIGIVTRTDLLKTLVPVENLDGKGSLGPRLEAALPPARLALVKTIAEVARLGQMALYIVGGYVRDLLLERPGLDFDLVVEGDAIPLARHLARRYGGRVTSHAQFGTAKWFLPQEMSEKHRQAGAGELEGYLSSPDLPATVDLVTARTEFYTHPTALPTVERGSIKLDLHRRDFTINTLAIRLDGHHWGELHDYWGGLIDLRQGLVRCLHSLSFVDDPTRMLRAVRFEQRFAFHIEDRTLHLLKEAFSLLDRVSGDRIRHELDHMLDEPRAPAMLQRAQDLGLLGAIHPDLQWDEWIDARLQLLSHAVGTPAWGLEEFPYSEIISAQANPRLLWSGVPVRRALGYLMWFMHLPTGEAESITRRLKIARLLRNEIRAASALWRELLALVDAPPSTVAARLDEVSPLAVYAVYLAAETDGQRWVLQQYITVWRKVTITITGRELKAYGLPPGPQYKSILLALRSAWLDGQVTNPEQEKAFLEELLRQAELEQK